MAEMPDVLFVSKPVAPPWNDSNKNLVRDVARGLTRYRPRVMVPRGVTFEGAISEPIYAEPSRYAPSRAANARVLARLAAGARADIWHFFFGPNPLTLRAGRIARAIRRARTVHTIASAPDDLEAIAPMLFADRVIVLSEHTRMRLEKAGVGAVAIPPALAPLIVARDAIDGARAKHGLPERFVLYPGDLEFGNGAETFVRVAASSPDIGWVVASRPKTPRAHEARATLEKLGASLGADIVWLGEIDDIHAVIAAASAVTLVTDTLHAKMDWPLVLLEALRLEVPVFVAASTAAAELDVSGGAMAVPAGDPDALVRAVRAWFATASGDRTTRLREAAAWVERTCAPFVVARAYETLYDELMNAP
jgi:phosphatidylinositol alpha-1,6-mannosyltransferase